MVCGGGVVVCVWGGVCLCNCVASVSHTKVGNVCVRLSDLLKIFLHKC